MDSTDSSDAPVQVHRVAATVILLRDGAGRDGAGRPEVLMLERPHDHGAFAGAWVFPGGSVDVEDGLSSDPELVAGPGEEAAARRAAVREVREETALAVPAESLELVSCWTPPAAAPRRFRTWFYYAQAPAGEVVLSPGESIRSRWIRSADALELHAAGTLALVPPTWVTLHSLADDLTVADALDRARRTETEFFATRIYRREQGQAFVWSGDVAYADAALFEQTGNRHRLETGRLPWVYSRFRAGSASTGSADAVASGSVSRSNPG